MNSARAVQYYQEKVDPTMFNMDRYLGGIDKLYQLNFQTTADKGKLAIKEKATKIFNAIKKAEANLKDEAKTIKDKVTVENIKFDDLLGGKITDPEILKLQRELADLLIH
jgi:hypothetical protein